MADETQGNVTTRDMLFRIDGKLDAVANKQQQYEIEAALLKARVEEIEKDLHNTSQSVRTQHEKTREGIAEVQREQQTISARQKATAYIVAAVVTASTVVTPIVLSIINNKG